MPVATQLQQGSVVNISTGFNNVQSNLSQTTVGLSALTSVTPLSWVQPQAATESSGLGHLSEKNGAMPQAEPSSVPSDQNPSDSSSSNREGKQSPGTFRAAPDAGKLPEAAAAIARGVHHAAEGIPNAAVLDRSSNLAAPVPDSNRPAAGSPQLPGDLLVQVLEHGKLLRTSTLDEVTLQLKPEFLGKISIKASLENGQMMTRISVENSQVAQFLNENAGWLRSSLGQVEIQVQRIENSDGSMSSSGFNQKESESQQDSAAHRGSSGRRSASGLRIADIEPEEELAAIPSANRLDVRL